MEIACAICGNARRAEPPSRQRCASQQPEQHPQSEQLFFARHYPAASIFCRRTTMPKSARGRANWRRPGSPIGRNGPRKAHPRYTRNKSKIWSTSDLRTLRKLARGNTPTRVIGLKLGRTATSVRGKAQREGISLRPANRSPYGRRQIRSRR